MVFRLAWLLPAILSSALGADNPQRELRPNTAAKTIASLEAAVRGYRVSGEIRKEMRALEKLTILYRSAAQFDSFVSALVRQSELLSADDSELRAGSNAATFGDTAPCLAVISGSRMFSLSDVQNQTVRCAELALSIGDRTAATKWFIRAAVAAHRAGDRAAIGSLLERASRLNAETPNVSSRLVTQNTIAGAWMALGEVDRATTIAKSVIDTVGMQVDPSVIADAEGLLGAAAVSSNSLDSAIEWTRLALMRAERSGNPGALYRWQWQLGRIHRAAGRVEPALSAYVAAIKMAEQAAVVTVTADEHGTAPPWSTDDIYLDYASLLTDLAQQETGLKRSQFIELARQALVSRRSSQLTEYYGDDCFKRTTMQSVEIDVASANTLVIYPMFLPDRVQVIYSKSGELGMFTLAAPPQEIRHDVEQLRGFLEKRTTLEYLKPAQKLYDELIRPLEARVPFGGLDTLVIVPDGPLHRIPLATLHDGNRFLIERVAVATSPGLRLSATTAIAAYQNAHLAVLAAGLSDATGRFPPLPYVNVELRSIQERFPRADELLNGRFEVARIERQVERRDYTVVHIASHATFNRTAGASTILTKKGGLGVRELDTLLRRSTGKAALDLFVLSACETAEGDERAALGLGGVAVKAGARSAIATLWHINDGATEQLMREFYSKWPGTDKARALQLAQQQLLKDPWFRHPAYWAPFLLINDWR